MANRYEDTRRQGRERTAGSGVVTAGEAVYDLKRARRHTTRVKLLRYGFPALALVAVAVYALTVIRASGLGSGLSGISMPRISPENLTMDNPHYEGFGKDGSSYVLNAATAQQDFANPTGIKLNGITGTLTQLDKTETHLTAKRGIYDSKTTVLEMFDSIDVVGDNGMKAKLTRATVLTKDSVVNSNEPVFVEFPSGTIRSKAMSLRRKSREVTFTDSVEAHLVPEKAEEKTPPQPDAVAKAADGAFKQSDAPVDITANRLDIDDKARTALFTGNVRSEQAGQVMTTPALTVHYDGDPNAPPGAKPATGVAGANGSKISKILAKGPVIMTRASGEQVTTDALAYDAVQQASVLEGNVVITSGPDRNARADRADLDQKSDKAVLTGNVFLTQGKNEFAGRRLAVDRKAGEAFLTSPPGQDAGPGRITARLYQGDGKAKDGKDAKEGKESKAKPAAATPVAATDAGQAAPGLGTFKTDPSAPVDIEADQLHVIDTRKTAVFQGDVKAVQGDFVIRTAELVATYTGGAGLADLTTAAPQAGGKENPAAELKRIEAKKKVVVTTKDGQTVTGDWADYDAKAATVTVGGEVVLSKAESMVRGTRLVIDMTTGESRIDTAPDHTVALPAGGGWVTNAPGQAETSARGRPSAVFFPNQFKSEGANKGKAAATAGAAAAGWQPLDETAPKGLGN